MDANMPNKFYPTDVDGEGEERKMRRVGFFVVLAY